MAARLELAAQQAAAREEAAAQLQDLHARQQRLAEDAAASAAAVRIPSQSPPPFRKAKVGFSSGWNTVWLVA